MRVKVKVLAAQLCLTLCNSMDCSLPGSSVHGTRVSPWAVEAQELVPGAPGHRGSCWLGAEQRCHGRCGSCPTPGAVGGASGLRRLFLCGFSRVARTPPHPTPELSTMCTTGISNLA